MNRAVGYIRVSTERQAVEGVSLDAQREKIRAWCDAQGYELLGVEVDAGISGKRAANRPGLQAALALACREHAALVVYSLSRLARSTRDALTISERLDKAGADLVSLSERIDTTSAAGKMIFRVLAVLAEFERDLISERTRGAFEHMRAQGEKTGGSLPFGYRLAADGRRLEPDPEGQRIVALIRRRHARGDSLSGIARDLEARAVPTAGGGRWTHRQVASVLQVAASRERVTARPIARGGRAVLRSANSGPRQIAAA